MDMEEGDLIDDRSSTEGGYQRRHSVSPLPQIRASNDNQMSRSSSDSDSEPEQTSSSRRSGHARSKRDNQQQHEESQQDGDICVGCLAAALNRKQRNNETCVLTEDVDSDSCIAEANGSKSLPATLKKYKGNHSTGSCRGMNPPDHYHPYPHNNSRNGGQCYQTQEAQHSPHDGENSQQSAIANLPFKFYKTDRGQQRKIRTPLRNLIPQSISAPCDTDSSLRVCIHSGPEQFAEEASTSMTATDQSIKQATEDDEPQVHRSQLPIDAKRRCSLSRNSSCSSADRKGMAVTCDDLKMAMDYSNEEDVSDETEPNSDNDLIVRRSERGSEKEARKK